MSSTTTTRQPLTEHERAQRRQADREYTRQAIEQLRTSPGWQAWLSSRRHFHSYSLTNQLLIARAMPEATRVAGFKAWLKLGYCVRRGEKAVIRIWMPIPPSKNQLEKWHAAGGDPDEKPRTRYKLGPVWDRTQVEPLPPPAKPTPLEPPITEPGGDTLAWTMPRLRALVDQLGCTLVFEDHPAGRGGSFTPSAKRISINRTNTVNHQVKTLIHELAHALLHLADRDSPELSYAQEELVVESVAFTTTGALGIDTSGYSIPYLASWSESAEIEVLERTAGLIDRLASRIETAVLGESRR